MSSTFYTADTHLFHGKVAELRGFSSPESWNAFFVERYRATVRKDDHVWFLGDMTGGGRVSPMLQLVSELPGVKYLITGNHDPVGPHNRKGYRYLRKYLEVFRTVTPYQRRSITGVDVLLSHYPYSGDHTERDRYAAYRLRSLGVPLLHGHTHLGQVTDPMRPEQFHVGLDAHNLELVPESRVASYLQHSGLVGTETVAKVNRQLR